MSQRFGPDANPIPPSREDRMRSWAMVLAIPAGIVLATMGGLMLLWEWSTSTASAPASASTRTSAARSSPDSTDLSLSAIAAAVQTMAAPSPTPTPEPTRTPTPFSPPRKHTPLCGMTARYEEVCEWPMPTMPPPTPVPDCATPIPRESCVWKGT